MKKIYLYIFGAIFILAAFGTFSYFYLKSQTKTNLSVTPTPSAIIRISPSMSQSSPLSNSPTTLSSSEKTTIKLFFIAQDDNGKSGKMIGCNDSVVAVLTDVPKTQAVLKTAMTELVGIKDEHYGQSGLYNALANSTLSLQSAEINSQGKATIKFSGNLQLLGTCEDPQIKAQLEETALQFSTVKSVEIFINDKNLDDLLSTRE